MIDLDEIRKEIFRLENADMTFSNLQRLAALYEVLKAHTSNVETMGINAREMSKNAAESEFKRLAMSVPQERLVNALDEHMASIMALYPKEYSYILDKIGTY